MKKIFKIILMVLAMPLILPLTAIAMLGNLSLIEDCEALEEGIDKEVQESTAI